MVQKFLGSKFVVMLFHYDGIVDEWKDFNWSSSAIRVSVDNQTKCWFAKRFLHPDIVAEYNYIFLWDEDLVLKTSILPESNNTYSSNHPAAVLICLLMAPKNSTYLTAICELGKA